MMKTIMHHFMTMMIEMKMMRKMRQTNVATVDLPEAFLKTKQEGIMHVT